MERVLNLFCHRGRALSITAEIKKYQVKQSKVTLELIPAEQPASLPTNQRAKLVKTRNMNCTCLNLVPLRLLGMALNGNEASGLFKWTKGWGSKPARSLNVKQRISRFSIKKRNVCNSKSKEKWYVMLPAEGHYQEVTFLKLTTFSLSYLPTTLK